MIKIKTLPTVNFDVISDLYLDSLDGFSWEGKASSLFCIVAGNISADRDVLYSFLEILADYYETVFFLDGELEHKPFDGDFEASYDSLVETIEGMDGVVFLHENIILMNGATLIGTNGWTTFDFTSRNPLDETIEFLDLRGELAEPIANEIFKMAVTDQHYLYNSISSCQTMPECENIVIVTNSVPVNTFLLHREDYDGTVAGDVLGNNGITTCLDNDTEGKVSTWVFGKFDDDIDEELNNVRFINNPGSTKDFSLYYPKIITF